MTVVIADSPQPALVASKATALYAEGVRAAILYINPLNLSADKTARKPHIDALHKAGIDVGFVCEGWGGAENFAHNDINGRTGQRHGATCGDWLERLGAPDGTAVYAAVDTDATATQIKTLCIPYFQQFRSALSSRYALGVYGCGALLFALESQQALVHYRWLSNAMGWSRSREYAATNRWDILQQRQTKLFGIDIDPDALNPKFDNFGFWKAVALQQEPPKTPEQEQKPPPEPEPKPTPKPAAPVSVPKESSEPKTVADPPGPSQGTET